MIPNNVKRGEVTNNLGATRSKKLGIDPRNIQFIMDLLTNMYSDEELAVVREYSTNAMDAQRLAGVTSPIRVSTPTQLAPFLKVKDQGTGMSSDDLLEMYTEYTTSTKREDAEANGFMGIGSKSGLAYSDQFSIISVKDGMMTVASISRGSDNSASMDIISEDATDEPNGTEVIIPAKAYHNFDRKAQNLFKFWPPGTVLINGAEPKRDDLEKMTERIYFHDGDNDIIVMGGVPYPLDREYRITTNGRRTATYVTMNGEDEVVIHPSRERLIYNGITTNVIAGIKEEFTAKIRSFVEAEIAGAPTFVEAYRLMNKYRQEYGTTIVKGISYNNLDLDEDEAFTHTENGVTSKHQYIMWAPGRTRNAVGTYADLNMHALNTAKMIIVGYKGSGVASGYKARIRAYAEKHGITISAGYYAGVLLYRGAALPEPDKTKGFEVHDWKTIMAETKEAVNYGGGGGFSYGGKYDVYNPDTNHWNVEAVESDAEILFFSESDCSLPADMRDRILKENPDIVFVKARANRHNKLQREYPNAKPFNASEWYKKFGKADFDALSEDDLTVLRARITHKDRHGDYNYNKRRYEYFRVGVEDIPEALVDQIEDPEYQAAAALYKRPVKVLEWARFDPRWDANEKRARKEQKDVPEFGKRYPLINWDDHPQETLYYVNAVYAKNKEN